jgi:hypothetical protein
MSQLAFRNPLTGLDEEMENLRSILALSTPTRGVQPERTTCSAVRPR